MQQKRDSFVFFLIKTCLIKQYVIKYSSKRQFKLSIRVRQAQNTLIAITHANELRMKLLFKEF